MEAVHMVKEGKGAGRVTGHTWGVVHCVKGYSHILRATAIWAVTG